MKLSISAWLLAASLVLLALAPLVVYPLYTAALILYLDARSRGEAPRTRDLIAAALLQWPRFALLTALNTLLILIGISLYFLPGLWLMVVLAFGEYLLVLRGMAPLAAMKESARLSRGNFWRILLCILAVTGIVQTWHVYVLDGSRDRGFLIRVFTKLLFNFSWWLNRKDSDGSYDVPEGLVSSFPVTSSGGEWQIVQGLEIDDFSRGKIDASVAELADEKAAVTELGLI